MVSPLGLGGGNDSGLGINIDIADVLELLDDSGSGGGGADAAGLNLLS